MITVELDRNLWAYTTPYNFSVWCFDNDIIWRFHNSVEQDEKDQTWSNAFEHKHSLVFKNETDAMAFKLRWI